jgi:hypothetical protein
MGYILNLFRDTPLLQKYLRFGRYGESRIFRKSIVNMVDYVYRHIHNYSSFNPKYNAPWTGMATEWLPHGLCYRRATFSQHLRLTALSISQGNIRPFLKMLWFQFFTPFKIYDIEIAKLFKFADRKVWKKQNRKALRKTHVTLKVAGVQLSYLRCSREICVTDIVPKTARSGRYFDRDSPSKLNGI